MHRQEVRSTFNLWSTMLAETRTMAKDRATHAETLALEMVARLDIMAKDVSFIYRKVNTSSLLSIGEVPLALELCCSF